MVLGEWASSGSWEISIFICGRVRVKSGNSHMRKDFRDFQISRFPRFREPPGLNDHRSQMLGVKYDEVRRN